MHSKMLLAVFGTVLVLINAAQLFDNDAEVMKRALTKTGEVVPVTTEEQKEYLEAHNNYRAGVGASNMETMIWDDSLAQTAAQWVEFCYFHHPNGSIAEEKPYVTPGQNLYGDSVGRSNPTSPKIVTKAWYDEKQWYDINSNTCSAPPKESCGHYIQVVYSTAHKVGCAKAYCKQGSYTGWIYACNYESGVLSGSAPYKEGAECTQCKSGKMYCKNKLCVDSCTSGDSSCSCKASCGSNGVVDQSTCSCNCNVGYASIDCSEKCEDKDALCGSGWYSDWCDRSYVKEGCPKMCGLCTPVAGECKDKDSKCGIYPGGPPGWPESWCPTYAFVRDNCPKMCNLC